MEKKIILLKLLIIFVFSEVIFAITNENNNTKIAIFAGGCFWCMESDFEKIPGVIDVISGYTGGTTKNPTYQNYSKFGHIEAIKIFFKPAKIKYSNLLKIFWLNIDPLDEYGQFCDRGKEYSSAIFYLTKKQEFLAKKSKKYLEKLGILNESIKTKIMSAGDFFNAEEYHQDYYKKNPLKYKYYRFRCERDKRLGILWGKNNGKYLSYENRVLYKKTRIDEIKKKLTTLQFNVTQKDDTEPPFRNKFWNNNREGIYVDIVSGEPLFSSKDKYKSGTGWPSFKKPIAGVTLIKKKDNSFFTIRTELRSKYADSHLGHLFDDGPKPTGLRYCINSAALRFIPKTDLVMEGFYPYIYLFED